jgi:hypothetical protein
MTITRFQPLWILADLRGLFLWRKIMIEGIVGYRKYQFKNDVDFDNALDLYYQDERIRDGDMDEFEKKLTDLGIAHVQLV